MELNLNASYLNNSIGGKLLSTGLTRENKGARLKSRMAKKRIPAEVTELFRGFGRQGGKKRSKNLTPEQRSEIARKAGKAGGRGRKKAD